MSFNCDILYVKWQLRWLNLSHYNSRHRTTTQHSRLVLDFVWACSTICNRTSIRHIRIRITLARCNRALRKSRKRDPDLRDARLYRANVIRIVWLQRDSTSCWKVNKVCWGEILWLWSKTDRFSIFLMDLRSVFGSQSENFTLANFIDFSTWSWIAQNQIK